MAQCSLSHVRVVWLVIQPCQVRALTDVELIVFGGNELHYLLADTQIARRVKHLMQVCVCVCVRVCVCVCVL
jgi:hypothetical protein